MFPGSTKNILILLMALSTLSFLWCFSLLFPFLHRFFPHFSWPLLPLLFSFVFPTIILTSCPLLYFIFVSSSISLLSSIYHAFFLCRPLYFLLLLLPLPSHFSLFRSGDSWPLCITETHPHTLYSSGRYMGHEYSYGALCAVHTTHSVRLLYFPSVPVNVCDVCIKKQE